MALRSRFARDPKPVGRAAVFLMGLQTAALGAVVGTSLAALSYAALGSSELGIRSTIRIAQDFFLLHWQDGAVAGAATGAARHFLGLPGFVAGLAGLLVMFVQAAILVLLGPLDPVLALQGLDPLLALHVPAAMFVTVWIGRRLLIV